MWLLCRHGHHHHQLVPVCVAWHAGRACVLNLGLCSRQTLPPSSASALLGAQHDLFWFNILMKIRNVITDQTKGH